MKKNITVIVGMTLFASALFAEPDQRQRLELSEIQRAHVLAEMRALLSGVQGIVSALGDNDLPRVAQTARPLGMSMARKAEDHLKGLLPQEFMQLGMAVHRDFDQLATDAESIADVNITLGQLGDLMNKCVACHNAYQIRVSESPARIEDGHHRH